MGDRPGGPALLWGQIRYQNKVFWRTPVAAFFTLVFPLLLLVVFGLLLEGRVEFAGGELSVVQFYVPSLAVFAAASATYTNLAVRTAFARERGILKRIRGTPLPPWIHLAGRIGSAVWVALIGVAAMLGLGAAAYGVTLDAARLPAAGATFLVGVACFAALGLGLAGWARTGQDAEAAANATLLPLAFVSDVFVPIPEDAPAWLRMVGDVFPLEHFVVAFRDAFRPGAPPGVEWGHLAVMALWGIAGLAVAVRTFRWEPGRPARRRSGLRS